MRELLYNLFEELTGGRVYHIYIWPGGVRRDFPEGFADRIVSTLHSIGGCVPDYRVPLGPAEWLQGRDPQLEKAVALAVEAAAAGANIPVTTPIGTIVLIALVAAAALWRLRWRV